MRTDSALNHALNALTKNAQHESRGSNGRPSPGLRPPCEWQALAALLGVESTLARLLSFRGLKICNYPSLNT